MTWHLKDRDLEEKLIAIDSNFCVRLHNTCEREFRDEKDENQKVDVLFSTSNQLLGRLYFKRKMIEDVPEYDPNNWNEYPAVTPPEGVLMRIEASYEGDIYRQCAIFKNGIWKHEENGDAAWCLLGKVKRFRPWSED